MHLPTFPPDFHGKESSCKAGDAGDTGSIPGWEDPLEEGMQSTPIFLPGESYGQRSLAGYSRHGHKESDTTEATEHAVPVSNLCHFDGPKK